MNAVLKDMMTMLSIQNSNELEKISHTETVPDNFNMS
jgi:hypothetical protein